MVSRASVGEGDSFMMIARITTSTSTALSVSTMVP